MLGMIEPYFFANIECDYFVYFFCLSRSILAKKQEKGMSGMIYLNKNFFPVWF